MKSLSKKIIEGLFDADIDKAIEELNWSLDWIKDEVLRQYLWKRIVIPEVVIPLDDCKKLVDDMGMNKDDLGKLLQIFKLVQELPKCKQRKCLMVNIIDPIIYIEQLDYCFKFMDLMGDFLMNIDKLVCKNKNSFKFIVLGDDGGGEYWLDAAFIAGSLDDKDFKPFERMRDVEVTKGGAKYDHIVYSFSAEALDKEWNKRLNELNSLKK